MSEDPKTSARAERDEATRLRRRVAELEALESQWARIKRGLCRDRDFSLSLIQACPAFLVVIDRNGKTALMNDAMLSATGYTSADVVGTDYVSTFVPEEDREQLAVVFDDIMVKSLPTVSENHVLTKDGRKLLVEWRGRTKYTE